MPRALILAIFLASSANAAAAEPAAKSVVCTQQPAMSQRDSAVLSEINRARQSPRQYANTVQAVFATMDASGVYRRGERVVATVEGASAVQEAVRFLLDAEPVPPLQMASCLNLAAARHAKEKGRTGGHGHFGVTGTTPSDRASLLTSRPVACSENIAYGYTDVAELVSALIVDDSVPSRGHRANIFDPRMKSLGSGTASHLLRRTIDVHVFCIERLDDQSSTSRHDRSSRLSPLLGSS